MRLLPAPEPVEAQAADEVPTAFRWRRVTHAVARAEGPERIAPEWWRDGAQPARDYWRVEDEHGRRFWLYRVPGGAGPCWYVHGLLA
jgi:protein ImuB